MADESRQKKRAARIVFWFIFWLISFLAGLEWLLSTGFPFNDPAIEPYLMKEHKDGDDWTHSLFELERIAALDRRNVSRVVVYMGGSAARESVSSERAIERHVRFKLNHEIRFFSLCSMQQNFFDAGKIFASGRIRDSLVILAISPLRFANGASHGLDSIDYLRKGFYTLNSHDLLDDVFSRFGFQPRFHQQYRLYRASFHFGTILNEQIHHLFEHGALRRVHHKDHRYLGKEEPGKKKIKRLIKGLGKRVIGFNNNHDFSMHLFLATLRLARQYGNEVILLDLPFNPAMKAAIDKFEPKYSEVVQKLIDEHNLPYIDMREAAKWSNKDFVDALHMRPSGRKKFMRRFKVRLVSLLNGTFQSDNAFDESRETEREKRKAEQEKKEQAEGYNDDEGETDEEASE